MLFPRLMKLHANLAAFRGQTKEGRREIRYQILNKYHRAVSEMRGPETETHVFSRAQDCSFSLDLRASKKLMVVFIPEHPTMSGGIHSMFSIAKQLRRLKRVHGYDVIIMTRPNPDGLTYFRNSNFQNTENVFRIEQLLLCEHVEDLYIHVPEYAASSFVQNLTENELKYLLGRDRFYVNLLNQNIQLMPEKDSFASLRKICDELTQSVAHHAYFTQSIADKYELPTLLLPAYTDISEYPPSGFAEKERLIIYSPDDNPCKQSCLDKIRKELPNFELREIRDITFDRFMDLATRCMFSITFGEGFDGYLAQPIHQGGIGFAAYNDEFFPSPHFAQYYNIFSTNKQMVGQICDRIKTLASNRAKYELLNQEFCKEYERLYSFEDYLERIKRLALREFEIWPRVKPANQEKLVTKIATGWVRGGPYLTGPKAAISRGDQS